ncbi:hypothetical protein AAHE18_19G167900 [Arachis hypogaea]
MVETESGSKILDICETESGSKILTTSTKIFISRENMLLDDTCPCNLVSQLCSMAIRLQDSNNLAFAECKEDQSNILDVIKSNQLEKQLIEVKQFCQSSGNNSIKARSLEEEAQAQLDLQLAQETAYANFARDLSNELEEVDIHLKNLKEMMI